MGLDYMLDTLPLTDVIARVLKGSGECAEQGWVFLGLAIPSWTFVFFIGDDRRAARSRGRHRRREDRCTEPRFAAR